MTMTKCIAKTDILEAWQFLKPNNDFDLKTKQRLTNFGYDTGISIVKTNDDNYVAYLPDATLDDTIAVNLRDKDILLHNIATDKWWVESYNDYVVEYQELK